MECCSVLAVFLLFLVVVKVIEHLLRQREFSTDELKNRYVLITGCDTGFGNLLAKRLDKRSLNVFACCLTEDGKEDLEKATSSNVRTFRMDVTDHESITKVFEEVKKILPSRTGLWGIVNNAGIMGFSGPLDWVTAEYYEKIIKVNLVGMVDTTLTFLPLIYKARGRVVNIASSYGRFAFPVAGYSESKFGVEAFSDSLRYHFISIRSPCRVSILEPGFFQTNLNDTKKLEEVIYRTYEKVRPEIKAYYPGGKPYIDAMIKENNAASDFFSTPDISLVVDAYEHALVSKWPKKRYSIHWDAKVLWIPLYYMPSFIQDALIYCTTNRGTGKF